MDDEIVKEYNNLFELLNGITVDILKINGKAFFYPVMLIYKYEELYNYKFCKNNLLDENDYKDIINKCNEAIYEYQSKSEIKEEYKSDNYVSETYRYTSDDTWTTSNYYEIRVVNGVIDSLTLDHRN